MAGKLTISTLNDDTGVLATQNGMSGIAKAWVNFNGTGTVAIRASFNVSSVTDNGGTGNYTVNFTTAMPDANYAIAGAANDTNSIEDPATMGNVTGGTYTASAVQVRTVDQDNANRDGDTISVIVFR
jgi:hypothetical protein